MATRSATAGAPKDYALRPRTRFRSRNTGGDAPFRLPDPGHRSTRVVETCSRNHGIRVETLKAATELEVVAETIDKFTKARGPFEKHETIDITETTAKTSRRTLPAGTVVVLSAQPLGTLAVYLLEPRSDDGLATWNFFDEALVVGQEFPVLKLPRRVEPALSLR